MSTESTTATRGFGYQPGLSGGYHFEVRVNTAGGVTLSERHEAGANAASSRKAIEARVVAEAKPLCWQQLQGAVANEFNSRLKQGQLRPGRWLKGPTPLAPHFGKELALLLWAVEDQDTTVMPRMLANWRGLAPEERWWFYTTISATRRAADANSKYGWRAAIKVAFLADPQDLGLESLHSTSLTPANTQPPSPPQPNNPQAKHTAPSAEASSNPQGSLFSDPSLKT